jgi:hypothetical protein
LDENGQLVLAMAEELPGFIPHILRREDVSLLRADEAVFNSMVDDWRISRRYIRATDSPAS